MKKFLLLPLFLLTLPFSSFADSPITSTDFWKAYKDVKIVQYARDTKKLDKKIAKYLLKKRKPLAIKAAVINALSWDIEGKSLDAEFGEYLAKKYKTVPILLEFEYDKMPAGELMALGYMTVMSDYFDPAPSIPILKAAVEKVPESRTANMMLALAESQAAFDSDWCKVYQVVEKVRSDTELNDDLKPEAVNIIMEYIDLYKADCK